MTVSAGVCQCHGTRHPGFPLKRMTDAPLPGSPLCTEALRHEGRPGTGSNLFSDILRTTPWAQTGAATRQAISDTTILTTYLRVKGPGKSNSITTAASSAHRTHVRI